MKKISISLVVILILTSVLYSPNTFAQNNLTAESDDLISTSNGISLTHFNLESQEVSTLNLSSPLTALANDFSSDIIEGYIPEDYSISPNYVIDDDSRQLANINSYPFKCIGMIQTLFSNGHVEESTAFAAGQNNMLLTTGHSVYKEGFGNPVLITFFPGYSVDNASNTSVQIAHAFTPNEWTSNYDEDYDWAIIITSSSLSCGYLGIRKYANYSDCVGNSITLSGYPTKIESNVTRTRFTILR